MIRIPVSLFDFIKDDKGGFKISINNDRAAIFNYGIRKIADRLLEVAKSWTFKGLDEAWDYHAQYDKKSHLIKALIFKNDAPGGEHTGGLSTEQLWTIMEEGREGWRQGVDAYTFDTYPDREDARQKKDKRKSDRRSAIKFIIARSRNRGSMLTVGRARLGDIYPTKPEFWLDRAMNLSLKKFADQIEIADFGDVDGDFVPFGSMPVVEVIPNLYELASGRGDLDTGAEESEDFLYGPYGGSHRIDEAYGGIDPTPPWYASYY